MISLRNLELRYGERPIFKDVSANIGAKDRIGLVGSNGAGKTTLLRILTGSEQPDSGKLDRAKNATIGYLPQDGISIKGKTLFQEAESAFEAIKSLKSKIEEASKRIQILDTNSEEYANTLEMLGIWEHEMEGREASKLPSLIESVLLGLGFSMDDMNRPTEEFSGGWQMRIALAKLLLAKPSLLLLDEPTNHLDISSQRWLELYLNRYEGSLLMVSHDRAFLDELCKKTFELSRGRLTSYAGNYTCYEKESKLRKEQLERSYKSQQREIQKTQRFIERFRYKNTKASQVQSRIKALDKVELIEIEQDEASVAFEFPKPPRSGQKIIEIENLRKAYDDLVVLDNASIRIERGDRIAVVGVNGAGKSTLAKVLAGVEPFQAGERILGGKTHMAYFAQHQADELDPKLTALETLEKSATGEIETRLRSILGGFLFHGDDVFKKVKVLSGGERNRLALAKILTCLSNFLILDEPTNHLDMRSQEALQEALEAYEGSFLIVSHNRAFVDPIVNKVLEIRKDGLSFFPGNVSDYLRHLELISDNAVEKEKIETVTKSALSPKEKRRLKAEEQRKISPLKSRSKELEESIAALEKRQKELEEQMSGSSFYENSTQAKYSIDEYESNKKNLEENYDEWDELVDEIARREEALGAL